MTSRSANFIESLFGSSRIDNYAPFLPIYFRLDGKPMSLRNHFFFSPIFSNSYHPNIVLKTGRQLGKTRSIAVRMILQKAIVPGHVNLIVYPLQEQADRMSSIIFRPILEDSPIRKYLGYDKKAEINASVRRIVCNNRSMTHFQYTGDDANRIRQITADWVYVDEAQDHLPDQIPIVDQCLSSKVYPTKFISGTSKSNQTYLEENWQRSSQAIWHIHCPGCGFENICCVDERGGHLFKMLGPIRDDISFDRPGLVCAGCQNPINPKLGRWVHRYPERAKDFPGYYIPQVIAPIHCCYPNKWAKVIGRWNGEEGYTIDKFYNEILGEAFDNAFTLVGVEDLKSVGILGPNDINRAIECAKNYNFNVLGIDWGGGGAEGVSRTKIAFACFNPDGTVDINFGMDFPPTTDFIGEAKKIVEIAYRLGVHYIAHDYNGAITREAFLHHIGWSLDRLIPMVYRQLIGGNVIEFQKPIKNRTRGYYVLDKACSLQLLCSYIRTKKIKFFNYDYEGPNKPGLLHDFLNLVEEKVETPNGEVYRVRKSATTVSDDFAHAVNYAVFAGWNITGWWSAITENVTVQELNIASTI